jgi:hypothetical protein
VLVCGGRDFNDYRLIWRTLDKLFDEIKFSVLIHGAARGADWHAGFWARGVSSIGREGPTVHVTSFPANWKKHGKSAGPIRNQLMLDVGKPDLVIAFPGGSGTADMIRRARKAGVPVKEIPA